MTRRPTEPWRNRIIGETDEDPDSLLANPHNWRIHSRAQRHAIAGVLNKIGWVTRVIVNQRTGHVIDGHARILVAMDRDESTVPVTWVDLDPDEERMILATLDPLAAMAGQDDAALSSLVSTLSDDLASLVAEVIDVPIVQESIYKDAPSIVDRSQWKTIAVDVPPETYDLFHKALRRMPGGEIHERLNAMLDIMMVQGNERSNIHAKE